MTDVQGTVEFYCVKCHETQQIPASAVQREHRPKDPDLLRAVCHVCGKKLVRLVKRQAS
jgi:NAD-dependent SIR2 family protein deacetylase